MKKDCQGKLAEGETTGHAHRVMTQVLEREDGIREFSGAVAVTHEEHGTITLPARRWNSDRVVETDHLTNLVRKVAD